MDKTWYNALVFKNRFTMILLLIALGAAAAILFPRMIMVKTGRNLIYTDPEAAPERSAAVVFGAGLRRDGTPTAVLRDRIQTAAELYFSGKAKKILMSGDNRFLNYNEPGAMQAYALELGVPEEDIVLDYAGRRTYDTCYRAQAIFGLREAVLVTQEFHLYRALYTCKQLGLDAVGVSADLRPYRDSGFWKVREIPASLMAFIHVHLTRPEPVLGEAEPIFPVE